MEEKICFNCKHLKCIGWTVYCDLTDETKTLYGETCDKFEYLED